MDKVAKVNGLITNGGFVEADRSFLMTLNEDGLNRLEQYALAQLEATQTAVEQALKQNEEGDNLPELRTMEQLIEAAHDEIKPTLIAMNETYTATRNNQIKAILAVKNNTFTENELKALPQKQLDGISRLVGNAASPAKPAPVANEALPRYDGNATVITDNSAEGEGEKPLPTPTMNSLFSVKGK